MRGMASTSACSWVTSWRLAPVRITASGMPCASVMRWCFEPGRARSVGLGPVFDPHQPRGSRRSRRPRATSLCGPLRVALQEAVRAVGPRHRRPASRADGASSSCRCRNPSRAARAHDLCRDVAPEVAERQDRRASLFLSAAASGGPGQAAALLRHAIVDTIFLSRCRFLPLQARTKMHEVRNFIPPCFSLADAGLRRPARC